MSLNTTENLFDAVVDFPRAEAQETYESLVGLGDHKERLSKEALLILKPEVLQEWSDRHYDRQIEAIRVFRRRVPLILFAGDVGTGKTALATSFADRLARDHRVSPTLYSLSLNSRGSGAVGEMTQLISTAFAEIRRVGANSPTVFLIDEADAVAQSREFAQMHHEDRAGVDALIRGLDELAEKDMPVVVVMCTNRVIALDPAVRRRAALTLVFDRPNATRRKELLTKTLDGLGVPGTDLARLVEATGELNGRDYGFTFSDITTRLIPAIILDAVPDRAVDSARAVEIAQSMKPTPPFGTQQQ